MSKKFKLKIGERNLVVDTKKLAGQSNGSVLVQYGDTVVLVTTVMSKEEREGINFFPLMVDYEEKYYAAGEIMGSRYRRREGRPSEEATCNARLIDRAIRPLFPKELKKDVQVVVTVLSWDGQNEPDVLGLLGASLALSISDIPWKGPVATVRVGRKGDRFILNPTYEEIEDGGLEIVFSAVERQGLLINMIEGNCSQVSEEVINRAYLFAKPYLKEMMDFENKIKREVGKEKVIISSPSRFPELEKEINRILKERLEKALYQREKEVRNEKIQLLKEEILNLVEKDYPEQENYAQDFFDQQIEGLMRRGVLEEEKRCDGRQLDEVRALRCEAGILPRTHGSGLFCRGETKSLSILTLGAPGDVQLVERMETTGEKRFMHHYNFPPYSVGEVKPIRGPGRREIGHGMLAEKALLPVIPSFEDFPYTIRVVSEILSSNGSTSMASISSSSLSLMDAGAPIESPVTGIALGLITKQGIDLSSPSVKETDYKILTDIQGPEDHYGDMDLKVAGTKKGITAIQMDVKIEGIPEGILKKALQKAKDARLHILRTIKEVLKGPRPQLSPYAPRVLIIQIDPKKIGDVIGTGGKVINQITNEYDVNIDIEESGKIFVTADKAAAAKKAVVQIKNITREAKVGEVFQGKVKRITDFGAFVEILPGREGLLHISKLAPHHVEKVEDVVRLEDIVPVKVISIDSQGRIDLTLLNKKFKKRHGRKNPRSKR